MSLRGRLLVGMGVIALVLIGASVFITHDTESSLIARVDDQLRTAQPRFGGGGGGPTQGSLSRLWVGTVDAQGNVATIITPDIADNSDLPAISASDAATHLRDAHDAPFTVGSDGGTRFRVVASSDRDGHAFLIGLPLTDVDAAVNRLVVIEVGATLISLAILGLVIWWVIRLGVRPIKQMTVTATAIADGDLSHRVAEGQEGTEAGELGVALNKMLGSIEEAFDAESATEDRLRRFAADASHELRTPVTTIRGYAELYRAGGLRGDGELDNALRRTEQEAIRMGSLIEDLLLLARMDQGRPMQLRDVDLSALATDAANDAGAVDPDRDITAEIRSGVIVHGDELQLRQVVANLVGNALVHTPAGSPIEVQVRAEGDHGVVVVADHGHGMDPEVAAHAFERFYRSDPSRSRHHGGSGLGLSIVQAIVEAHGGAVDLAPTPGTGTTVRVVLPLANVVAVPSVPR